jgi:dienelactone hydrolase
MMRRALTWIVLAAILGGAAWYAGPTVARLAMLQTFGMRYAIDHRYQGWVDNGAPAEDLDAALRRINRPDAFAGDGSWAVELMRPARRHFERAVAAERAGKLADAGTAYHAASALYGIAYFPYISNEGKQRAFDRHLESYARAARLHFKPPAEPVVISTSKGSLPAYLRLPPGVIRPPVVIVTGGVDTWKGQVDQSANAMLAAGLAVLTMDMPGTGENPWALDTDAVGSFDAAIDWLKQRSDVDGARIAVYLRSFAGYFAVDLAFSNPNITAAVNVGGPVHLSFEGDNLTRLPPYMIATVRAAMRQPADAEVGEITTAARQLSLVRRGVLARRQLAPLLTVNGSEDELVPIADAKFLTEQGVKQELWIYEGDRHAATGTARENIPRAARWLKQRFEEKQP